MRKRFIIMAALLAAAGSVHAEIYELPPEGHDVVGAVSTITARYEDTLVDIARRHGGQIRPRGPVRRLHHQR